MQDDFASLFAFNRWATEKTLDACKQLTPAQYIAEPVPGWSSVRFTVWHIVIVVDGWLSALTGPSDQDFSAEDTLPTVDDALAFLATAYKKFDALLPSLTPARLNTVVTLQRRTRTLKVPPWVVLRHIVNHTTYHRGQIASKLKRLGVQGPETDLVKWAIEQIPQA